MKSNLISKSQTSLVLKKIAEQWRMPIPKIKNLKVYEMAPKEEIIVGQDLKILHIDEQYLPFLSHTKLLERFPSVIVDMGAVKFMCNGANVMRPGIKTHAEFDEEQIVCVAEETHHKFLAVGKAMVSSKEMDVIDRGEVIKNMHYVSDRFWNAGKMIKD